MAVTGFSLLLAAVSVLAALASVVVPAQAGQPDGGVRRIEVAADELSETLKPAEAPPPDFTAGQYIDSAGCVFVRTDGGWRGRIDRDGAPVCGYPPTLSARRTGPGSVAALFPEPELPRAARIERDLTQAIIPNLQAAELVAAPLDGRAGEGWAQGTPLTAASSVDAPSTGDPSPDPLHIGAMVARAPELSRQMAGAGRTDRLCALIGAGQAAPEAPGLGLCGGGPISLAALSRTASGARAGSSARARDGAAHAAVPPGKGKVNMDAARRVPRIAVQTGAGPTKTVPSGKGAGRDELRMIPPGARFVQAGSFRDTRQAQEAARKLARMGLPVVRANEGKVQLVMVGPLEGREAIVRMIERLRRAGYRNLRARR